MAVGRDIVIGHKEKWGRPSSTTSPPGPKKELLEKLQCMEEYDGAEATRDCQMTLGEWLEVWLAGEALRATLHL